MRRLALLAQSVLVLTLLLLAPVATVRGQAGTPPAGSPAAADPETLARRFFEDLLNRVDPAAVDELLAPGFVLHLSASYAMPPAEIAGGDAFMGYVAGLHAAFPDVQYTVEDITVAGDEAVARWTVGGTHLGEFQGIPATGNAFAGVNGIDVFRFEGDRIAEAWAVVDTFGLLTQLGVGGGGTPAAASTVASAGADDQQWFVLTSPGEPTRVVATGALGAAGIVIDLLRLNPDGSFDNLATQVFADGTLFYHGAGTFRLAIDPVACAGDGAVVGPFDITGGRGAYTGSTGGGVALISLRIYFEKTDGECTQQPARVYIIARAAGTLTIP